MITASSQIFPFNVILHVDSVLDTLDIGGSVFQRPLDVSDPDQSIGVFPMTWEPNEDSYEVGSKLHGAPTLNVYNLGVQAFNKDTDRLRGLSIHAHMAGLVRNTLASSPLLVNNLRGLTVSTGATKETLHRIKIRGQRFLENSMEGSHYFLSSLDLSIETESR